MKRLMPPSLISFLQSNANVLRADLFAITLPTGVVMTTTDGQFDITIPSGTPGWTGATTTFTASSEGCWFRGAITSEASFECKSNTMSLTCVPIPSTTYPSTTMGILSAALQGLFEPSTVTVYTAYMPLGNYGNVSAGIETKFVGTIAKINDIDRVKVEFECADPMYLLDMKIPTRLFQSDCPWSFCDSNCTLSAANYTVAFTAKTGSTNWTLTPTVAFTQAAGYFTQGVVSCTAGANSGLSQTVKLHDTAGNLELSYPYLFPVTAGDTFSVLMGCNKTMSSCASTKTAAGVTTNNLLYFGGTPFTPVPSSAV